VKNFEKKNLDRISEPPLAHPSIPAFNDLARQANNTKKVNSS
jgi:hypothetical protein